MPLTLAQLAADSRLRLVVLAGGRDLDRPIAWVHGTELDDPTPFLEGGELLLTTGLRLSDDPNSCAAFVGRLRKAGVCGLGFGTGLSHEVVPAAMVKAAEAQGLPLLEVPHATPFIAISKAVSRATAADQYAAVVRVSQAHRQLSKAGIGRDGLAALITRLATLVNAWVLLLDNAGGVVHAAPAKAAGHAGSLAPEIDRLRKAGMLASGSFQLGKELVSLQALGSRARGFLAAGRREVLGETDRQIVNTAAALITLALEQSRELKAAHRYLRTGLFHLLIAGQEGLARTPAKDLWGPLPDEPVVVYAFSGKDTARAAVADLLEAEGGSVFFAEAGLHVVVLAGDALADRVSRAGERIGSVHLGVSEPVWYADLAEAYRHATQAADSAARAGVARVDFADLAGQGLLRLLPPERAYAYSESLLKPLLRHDSEQRGDLVESLRVWLEQHGQWDPAATRLGVHRHTLRHRMRKVEQLTGRSLDVPGFRAELWVALLVWDEGLPSRTPPAPPR